MAEDGWRMVRGLKEREGLWKADSKSYFSPEARGGYKNIKNQKSKRMRQRKRDIDFFHHNFFGKYRSRLFISSKSHLSADAEEVPSPAFSFEGDESSSFFLFNSSVANVFLRFASLGAVQLISGKRIKGR